MTGKAQLRIGNATCRTAQRVLCHEWRRVTRQQAQKLATEQRKRAACDRDCRGLTPRTRQTQRDRGACVNMFGAPSGFVFPYQRAPVHKSEQVTLVTVKHRNWLEPTFLRPGLTAFGESQGPWPHRSRRVALPFHELSARGCVKSSCTMMRMPFSCELGELADTIKLCTWPPCVVAQGSPAALALIRARFGCSKTIRTFKAAGVLRQTDQMQCVLARQSGGGPFSRTYYLIRRTRSAASDDKGSAKPDLTQDRQRSFPAGQMVLALVGKHGPHG